MRRFKITLHKDKCKFQRAKTRTAYLPWYSQSLLKTKLLKPSLCVVLCLCDDMNERQCEWKREWIIWWSFRSCAVWSEIGISVEQIRYIRRRLNILIQFADFKTKAVKKTITNNKNHGFSFDTIVRTLWTINKIRFYFYFFIFGWTKTKTLLFSMCKKSHARQSNLFLCAMN